MFRKKAGLGTQSLLGNKDRKKLRDQALKLFPSLSESDFDALLPPKEEISVAKLQFPQTAAASAAAAPSLPALLSATGSNRGSVYACKGEPIFFDVNGLLIPSVYALWRLPCMLPTFVVHAPVSSFILKGADLMLPGVIWRLTLEGEDQRKKVLNAEAEKPGSLAIDVQQLWAVRVAGNKYPFAVGRSAVAAHSLHHLAGKGKALEIIHAFGDGLWQLGSQSSPNSLFTAKQILGAADDAETAVSLASVAPAPAGEANEPAAPACLEGDGWDDGSGAADEKPAEEETAEDDAPDEPETPTREAETPSIAEGGEGDNAEENAEEDGERRSQAPTATLPPELMDEYLRLCALEILHAISDDQLPMDISALNSKIATDAPAVYVEKLRGEGKLAAFVPPDVRKASYKKLTKFVQSLSKKKLLQTKEVRGVVSMVKVNRKHPDYLAYTPIPEKTKKKIAERIAATEAGSGAATQGDAGVETADKLKAGDASPSCAQGCSGSGPLVLEFCVPPQKLLKIFQALDVQTGKDIFFTFTEAKEILTRYVEAVEQAQQEKREDDAAASPMDKGKKQSGGRGDSLVLDPLLKEALLSKDELAELMDRTSEVKMKKEQVFSRWQALLQPCHAIVPPGAPEDFDVTSLKIHKGPWQPVKITVDDRFGGRKHITSIVGVHAFLLDPKTVAEYLQRKLASAASTYAPPGQKEQNGIIVQGNMATAVADALVSHFKLQRKYLLVDQKKPKSGGGRK
ncbi:translation initiation factor sui1 protein [Besnoitia besnoiti]|uniref:Translation initiation factor sui1 protein n=1 Tax=Besnoitia besnoiti TaxID=94643 RepID=A0A2A9M1G5_BESBE|nr:translation initiation factor sui1 protein [Besnoitia besnoiti]PFH32338.1 translation initiation factor sui1 protein [Besnoitia besnoiti]